MMQLTLRPICLCSAWMVRLVLRLRNRASEGGDAISITAAPYLDPRGGREGGERSLCCIFASCNREFVFIYSFWLSLSGSVRTRTSPLFLDGPHYVGYVVCGLWMPPIANSFVFGCSVTGGAGMRPTERPTNQSKSNFYTPPNAECLCSGIFAASLRRRRGRALQRGKVRELHNGGAAAVECN